MLITFFGRSNVLLVNDRNVIFSNSPKKSEYQKFEVCEEHGKAYEGNDENAAVWKA